MNLSSSSDGLLREILRRLAESEFSYAGCVQTTVARKANDGFENLLTKLECVWTRAATPDMFVYDYREIVVVRRWLASPEIRPFLETAAAEHLLELGEGLAPARVNATLTLYGSMRWSHSEWSEWPADIFTLEPASSGPWSPSGSFVSVGAPYFVSLEQLLATLFTIRASNWPNQFRGQIVMVVPDFRAMVRSLLVTAQSCRIDIECRESSVEDLVVKICAEGQTGGLSQFTMCSVDTLLECELTETPAALSVALLDASSGDLLHEKRYREGVHRSDPDVLVDSGVPEIEQLLLTGEGTTSEWKREYSDTTPEKLAKTCVAFANTSGGTVVFGIDDDDKVVGCNTGGLSEKVTSVLRERCDPIPEFTVRSLYWEGKALCVVNIVASPSSVHVVKDGGPYIRANKTNRTPTSYELTRLYRQRGLLDGNN